MILAIALALTIDALPIQLLTVDVSTRPSVFTFDGALSFAFDMTSHEVGDGERFRSLKVERQSLTIKAGETLSTTVAATFNGALAPAEMISIGGRMPGSIRPNALSFAVTGTATFTILIGGPSVVCPNFHLGRGSTGHDDNFWLGMPGCAPVALADTVGLRCPCGEQTIVFTTAGGDSTRSIVVSIEQ